MFDAVKIIVFILVSFGVGSWLKRCDASKELSILAIFILTRLLLNSFHEYSYSTVAAGLSINSLHSIFFCFIFFVFYIPSKAYFFSSNILIFTIIVFMLFVGLINSVVFKSIVSITKWILMAELITIFLYSFAKDGSRSIAVTLFLVYLYPVVMLMASVLLGVSKSGESDGSISFVGGFYHEAVFSMIILNALVFTVVCIYDFKWHKKYIIACLFFYIILLALINYRTSLIASMTTVFAVIVVYFWKGRFEWKFISLSLFFVALSSAIFFNYQLIVDRFSEIPEVVSIFSELIDSPELFSRDETKLLSGRLFLWSSYVAYVNEGPAWNVWIGYGMDSWSKVFLKYAHNTFISFYYEIGIVGVFLLGFLFFRKFIDVINIKIADVRVMFIGFFLSFLVLNLSTMPLWAIEGVFFFSYICAAAKSFSAKLVLKDI